MDITVIIPAYNASRYIARCLASVAAQGVEAECIVVDDASRDDTAGIIRRHIAADTGPTRYTLLTQPRNAGPSAARNRGIRSARGEYLFFLDADDALLPGALAAMLRAARSHDTDYVQGTYAADSGTPTPPPIPDFTADRRAIKLALLNYAVVPFTPHNRLVRRSLITRHRLLFPEGIIHEDNHWMFFLAKHVRRMARVTAPTYRRTHDPASLSRRHDPAEELHSYLTLLHDMAAAIDPFLAAAQRRLLLDTHHMAHHYLACATPGERRRLNAALLRAVPPLARPLTRLYLATGSTLLLRMLMKCC